MATLFSVAGLYNLVVLLILMIVRVVCKEISIKGTYVI